MINPLKKPVWWLVWSRAPEGAPSKTDLDQPDAQITEAVDAMLAVLKESTALLEREWHAANCNSGYGAAKLKAQIEANRAVLAQASEAGL